MRRFFLPAVVITMLVPGLLSAQGPDASYAAADIRVLAPGVVYNAGLLDLAAAYTKETGKRVAVTLVGMGRIVAAVKTDNPPADVITLPFELMSRVSLDGGVVPGTFLPLGRSEMGLAVRAGAPHPDISTVETCHGPARRQSRDALEPGRGQHGSEGNRGQGHQTARFHRRQ